MSKAETPAEAAANTTRDVAQQAGSHPGDAYNKMISEAQQEERKLGGASSAAYKQYIGDLSHDLQQAGVLPEMTLAWARNAQNHDALTNASGTGPGGKITSAGIESYINAGNPGSIDQSGIDPFNKVFATQLEGMTGKNGLANSDIANGIEKQQELVNQSGFVKALFADHNGTSTGVFKLLDTAAAGGTPDGRISQEDVQAFLKNEKSYDGQLKWAGYSQSQINEINSGLADWNKNWNNSSMSQFEFSKNGRQEMSITSIAQAYGFTGKHDDNQLLSAIQHGTFDSVPSDPSSSSTSDSTDGKSSSKPLSATEAAEKAKAEEAVIAKAKSDAEEAIIKASKVQAGDGYENVAAAILGKGASESEIIALGNDLQQVNNNAQTIYANESLVTTGNIAKLLQSDTALRNIFSADQSKLEKEGQ